MLTMFVISFGGGGGLRMKDTPHTVTVVLLFAWNNRIIVTLFQYCHCSCYSCCYCYYCWNDFHFMMRSAFLFYIVRARHVELISDKSSTVLVLMMYLQQLHRHTDRKVGGQVEVEICLHVFVGRRRKTQQFTLFVSICRLSIRLTQNKHKHNLTHRHRVL